MSIIDTLLDISNESLLNQAEKLSLRLIAKGVRKLQKRIKKLEEVIEAALRISDLWTLKEVETMFEDEAKALDLMKQGFEQALKG